MVELASKIGLASIVELHQKGVVGPNEVVQWVELYFWRRPMVPV